MSEETRRQNDETEDQEGLVFHAIDDDTDDDDKHVPPAMNELRK